MSAGPVASVVVRTSGRPDDVGLRSDGGSGWAFAAMSVRGAFHAIEGLPRQDACAHALSPSGRHLVIAIADGVGSAAHSDAGSHAAVTAACATIAATVDDVGPGGLDGAAVLTAVADAVAAAGEELAVAATDVATTLAVAVVVVESTTGDRRCRIILCGDSDAYQLGDEPRRIRPVRPLVEPEADSLTNALSSWLPGAWADHFDASMVLGPGDAVLLCTDGLGGPLHDGTGVVGDYLVERLSVPRPTIWSFAQVCSVECPGWFDDRTVAMVWSLAEPSAQASGSP